MGGKSCVAMNKNYGWHDVGCEDEYNYVCEKEAGLVEVDYKYYGMCYYME